VRWCRGFRQFAQTISAPNVGTVTSRWPPVVTQGRVPELPSASAWYRKAIPHQE
jgi:hypothetical protein